MTNDDRIMLCPGSTYAKVCRAGNVLGVDSLASHDLSGRLPDEWRNFHRAFIPGVS